METTRLNEVQVKAVNKWLEGIKKEMIIFQVQIGLGKTGTAQNTFKK